MAVGKNFELKGMKKFMRNLNNEVQEMRGRTHKGLINAAIVLQRAAEPGTPIDTGNLRASWFIVSYKTGPESDRPMFKGDDAGHMLQHHEEVIRAAEALVKSMGSEKMPVLSFGYSANYAPFVHENVGARFKRPSAHARWLWAALRRNRDKMLEEIRKEASF